MTLTKLRTSKPAEARSTTARAISTTSRAMAEQALFACLGNAHGGGLKGIAEIETRAADGGSETEEERGEECQTDGEGEHPSIHVNRCTQLAEGKLQQLRDS